MRDFAAYAAFAASPRAVYMGGPHNQAKAWDWFCNDTAHWALMGFGGLMIERDGAAIGQVAVTQGVHFPEPELGWFLFEGHEGHGYALEAAFALREWVYANTDLDTLVSCVDPRNAASIALATRLGAVIDPTAKRPQGETPDKTVVFRHPTASALQDGGMEAYV